MTNTDPQNKLCRAREKAHQRYLKAEAETERREAEARLALGAGSSNVLGYVGLVLSAHTAAMGQKAVVEVLDDLLSDED